MSISILLLVLGVTNINAQDTRQAVHYGISYNGSPMACSGRAYDSSATDIVALSYADMQRYPCGRRLYIQGEAGQISVVVEDVCPGCTTQVDLSESGITQVCGGLGSCQVLLITPD